MVTDERDLRSRDQRWRDRMFVSRGMVLSPAFAALRTAAAHRVLLILLHKCRVEKVRRPCSRDKSWLVTNNGSLTFSYREARELYGLTDGVFRRAIDELVGLGFIDIAHSGYGLHKDATLYAISDRWQRYATPEFQPAERPKRVEKLGFKKGNEHGKNAHEKDFQQLPATVDSSYA